MIQEVSEPSFLQAVAVFVIEGGFFMWGVMVIWFFGLALTAERFKALYGYDSDGQSIMNVIKKYVMENDVMKAVQACSNTKSLLPFVLRFGLKRANQEKEQIQDAIAVGVLKARPKLEIRIDYLGLIANLSTLFGLLGTINGLIRSFSSVAAADPSQKAVLLSKGIAEAMNCTAMGLVSAISMMVFHAMLTSKSNKIIAEIEEYSLELIDLLGTKKQFIMDAPPIPKGVEVVTAKTEESFEEEVA